MPEVANFLKYSQVLRQYLFTAIVKLYNNLHVLFVFNVNVCTFFS